MSFWGQLSLAIVSAIVLFFTMSATNWVRPSLTHHVLHKAPSTALQHVPRLPDHTACNAALY